MNFPPTFFANPGLQPEKSVGYDYGFEQPLLYDRFRLGVTYYHNDVRNLIETCGLTAGAPFPTSTLCNVGLATTYGNESFAAWKVTDRLTLRVDYTTTTAVDDITRLPLVRRPRNHLRELQGQRSGDRFRPRRQSLQYRLPESSRFLTSGPGHLRRSALHELLELTVWPCRVGEFGLRLRPLLTHSTRAEMLPAVADVDIPMEH